MPHSPPSTSLLAQNTILWRTWKLDLSNMFLFLVTTVRVYMLHFILNVPILSVAALSNNLDRHPCFLYLGQEALQSSARLSLRHKRKCLRLRKHGWTSKQTRPPLDAASAMTFSISTSRRLIRFHNAVRMHRSVFACVT